VARWQERLEPLNKRLAGGCHLTREISQTIEQPGLTSSSSIPITSRVNRSPSAIPSRATPLSGEGP
jgi:hypothetical protein